MADTRSLEQKRAGYVWGCLEDPRTRDKEYVNLAKGAPALVMSNGLMQTLAFYESKGKDHHKALLKHICDWLGPQQRKLVERADFAGVMSSLHGSSSAHFMRATDETLSLLRWIRQLAAAKNKGSAQ